MTKITGFDTFDVRFPTSRTLAGRDDNATYDCAPRRLRMQPALFAHWGWLTEF